MQTIAIGWPGGTEGAVLPTVAPFCYRPVDPFTTHNTLLGDSLPPGLLKKAQRQGGKR